MKTLTISLSFVFLLTASFVVLPSVNMDAEARSRSGGRSFSRRVTPPPVRRSVPPPLPGKSVSGKGVSGRSSGGSSLMSGLAGGMLGGMLGSMLFGGVASGMGGGFAGTGLGLFDILIIGGIIYFIYSRFVKKKQAETVIPGASHSMKPGNHAGSGGTGGRMVPDAPPPPPSSSSRAPGIDEEEFLELAQDIFFKVQAAWMHRDIDALRDLAGPELISLYESEFRNMQERGIVNRLENIAVRKVEIVDHGMDGEYEFVKVRFTASLLDFTVDERSGKIVEGDSRTPVKFQEIWTFARTGASGRWRLYGVEEAG